jgi:hypothetical protein
MLYRSGDHEVSDREHARNGRCSYVHMIHCDMQGKHVSRCWEAATATVDGGKYCATHAGEIARASEAAAEKAAGKTRDKAVARDVSTASTALLKAELGLRQARQRCRDFSRPPECCVADQDLCCIGCGQHLPRGEEPCHVRRRLDSELAAAERAMAQLTGTD